MSAVDDPAGRHPAADVPAGAAAEAQRLLAGLDSRLDAVERALGQLEERPPPTCARCGAVLVDVLLGRRAAAGGGADGRPDDLLCSTPCAP